MTETATNGEIAGALPVWEPTGWQREAVWRYESGYSYTGQDNVVGPCFVAYYVKPGTNWRAELCYFVVPTEVHEDDDRHGTFGVEQMSNVWQFDENDDAYNEDIDYDYGTVLCYDTVESATSDAENCALRNESHIFNV